MAHVARQIQSASTPSGTSTVDGFLNLISDTFQQQIQANSIYASIIWSFAVSGGLFLTFCFLRPRHNTVYAPRAKHADEKHAPPPLDRGFFSWLKSTRHGDEQQLVERIGLDAVVFLRFIRMLRNIFLLLTVFGCGVLIPINVVGGHSLYSQWSNVATLMKFTPQYIFGQKFWAYVVFA
jgi:calcium permeable stress-gated cation channel